MENLRELHATERVRNPNFHVRHREAFGPVVKWRRCLKSDNLPTPIPFKLNEINNKKKVRHEKFL